MAYRARAIALVVTLLAVPPAFAADPIWSVSTSFTGTVGPGLTDGSPDVSFSAGLAYRF